MGSLTITILIILVDFANCQTAIETTTTWSDDYDTTTSGWITDIDSPIISTNPDTNAEYHGPYTGDDDFNVANEINLSRDFYCTEDASVDLWYKVASCSTEDPDFIRSYIDDVSQITTAATAPTDTFSDDYIITSAQVDCPDTWSQISYSVSSIASVTADTPFNLRFQISPSYFNDKWLIWNVTIVCNPLYTTIYSSWIDDGSLETPGWSIIDNTITPNIIIPTWGSHKDDVFHGPYNLGTHRISRDFYCSQTASVYIKYTLLHCDWPTYADLYLNNVQQWSSSYVPSDLTQGPVYISSLDSVASCRDWYYLQIDADDMSLNGIDMVPYNTLFTVEFEIDVKKSWEWWSIKDIIITCIPNPTPDPTVSPSHIPTSSPTLPSVPPSSAPTLPSVPPTSAPSTNEPSPAPRTSTKRPSPVPSTNEPTLSPANVPTIPTTNPTIFPTIYSSIDPTMFPTTNPTVLPTVDPSVEPTLDPTDIPTVVPTDVPTEDPSLNPTPSPTHQIDAIVDDDTKTTADTDSASDIDDLDRDTESIFLIFMRFTGYYLYIIIGITSVLLICVIICISRYCNIKHNREVTRQITTLKKDMEADKLFQLQKISSQSPVSRSEVPVSGSITNSHAMVKSAMLATHPDIQLAQSFQPIPMTMWSMSNASTIPTIPLSMNVNGNIFGSMLQNLDMANNVLMGDVIGDMTVKSNALVNVGNGNGNGKGDDNITGGRPGYEDDEGTEGTNETEVREGDDTPNTNDMDSTYDNEDDDVLSGMNTAGGHGVSHGPTMGGPNMDNMDDDDEKVPPPPPPPNMRARRIKGLVASMDPANDEEVIDDGEIVSGDTTTGM